MMTRRRFSRALLPGFLINFTLVLFALVLPSVWLRAASAASSPQRLVSTAPSLTELLYALGLGNRVVGVDRFSRYPEDALHKTKVGDYATPNLEVIASLKPDLVLIPKNPVRLRERLEALHLKVLEVEQETLAGVFRSFQLVGKATGTEPEARKLEASVRQELNGVRARVSSRKPARMMFVVGRAPNRLEGLVVVGSGSYLNEVIEIAGGENVFRDAKSGYPRVSIEEVLSRNPEVIVDMGDMADTVNVSDAQKRTTVNLWSKMTSIAAVRNHRVFAVASDDFVEPGPRVVNAALEFQRMFHPEVVR